MESEEKKIKWCLGCKIEHPIEEFEKSKFSKDGLVRACKNCIFIGKRVYKINDLNNDNDEIKEKFCKGHKQFHSIKLFAKYKTKAGNIIFRNNCRGYINETNIINAKKEYTPVAEKFCKGCLIIHPAEMFGNHLTSKDGLQDLCKQKVNERSLRSKNKRKKEITNAEKEIINEKQCNKCKLIKNVILFNKHKYSKNGFSLNCKECQNKIGRNSYQKRKKSKRVYEKKRRQNPNIRIRSNISNAIYTGLKEYGSTKGYRSCLNYLGYTIKELCSHLEKQFEPWMNWNNYGKYIYNKWNDNDRTTWFWTIDHIFCQSDLPYTSMEDENFKKCWALENLRPLSAKQNLLDGVYRTRHIKKDK